MVHSYEAAPDIEVPTSNLPIPGYGLDPISTPSSSRASEPILVDTGTLAESAEFMPALRSVNDPKDLKWIWLIHTDLDHIGSLHQLLAENPQIRVITNFLILPTTRPDPKP